MQTPHQLAPSCQRSGVLSNLEKCCQMLKMSLVNTVLGLAPIGVCFITPRDAGSECLNSGCVAVCRNRVLFLRALYRGAPVHAVQTFYTLFHGTPSGHNLDCFFPCAIVSCSVSCSLLMQNSQF